MLRADSPGTADMRPRAVGGPPQTLGRCGFSRHRVRFPPCDADHHCVNSGLRALLGGTRVTLGHDASWILTQRHATLRWQPGGPGGQAATRRK